MNKTELNVNTFCMSILQLIVILHLVFKYCYMFALLCVFLYIFLTICRTRKSSFRFCILYFYTFVFLYFCTFVFLYFCTCIIDSAHYKGKNRWLYNSDANVRSFKEHSQASGKGPDFCCGSTRPESNFDIFSLEYLSFLRTCANRQ